MRTYRRAFPLEVEAAITRRAKDAAGRVRCEGCGAWMKSRAYYEIDHIIAEGLRPAADKRRRLTAADGRLLCRAVCHDAKTDDDKAKIGKAKRLEADDARPRVCVGVPALMRYGFVPAGDER
jgi:hypothetical protein